LLRGNRGLGKAILPADKSRALIENKTPQVMRVGMYDDRIAGVPGLDRFQAAQIPNEGKEVSHGD
jgi:hypothetical protein